MEQLMEQQAVKAPKIRFREFEGDWSDRRLGSIVSTFSGGTPSTGNRQNYRGDIPFIRSAELNSEFTELFISQQALDACSAKMVDKGDLLYAMYGATAGEVGISKIEGAINQAILCIRTIESTAFVAQWLTRQKEIILSTFLQGGQGNLSAEIVKALWIAIPSLPEQEKITAFLSSVDRRIGQLDRKRGLLEQYKRSVMQRLFSQQVRFKREDCSAYEDWEECDFGSLGEIVGGGTPDTDSPECWEGVIQWFTPTEIKSKYSQRSRRTITEAGLKSSSARILPKGTLLFTSRATVGDVSIASEECTTNQGFQSVIVNADNDIEFVYYLIFFVRKEFIRKAQGSTFIEISKHEMRKIRVNSPPLEEQQKIASFLSAIDGKIEAVGSQLAQMQQWKKGLLEGMFV